jgi:chorismate dehydratase
VAGFCVASRKQAGSIFLFSTKPIQELQGASISIIGAASTAQRLLHVLLRLKYRVQPAAYVPLDLPHDAFLLVGNQGLRQRMGAPGFPHTYDLGAEWYAWTGLPFVFSRWMVRHDVDPGDKALLQDTLYVGLEEGVNALYGIAKPRVDLLMLPRDIITYIQGLHYYVGLEEEKAIERFHQYLQQVAQ